MRVLNVHNRHAGPGGMEVLFESLTRLLRARGHDVIELHRDNADLRTLWSRCRAFGAAIYSHSTRGEVARLLERTTPDIVHVHNLFPQFSVSLLDACRDAGVPVVLSVQDYKLTCPTAQHLRHGEICDKCIGGREYYCAIHNCRGSRPMSVSYAIRNAFARAAEKFHQNVALFLCCSAFARDLLVRGGFPANRTRVLSNYTDIPPLRGPRNDGDYIAYVGRISPEKGLDILLAAAYMTGLPVRIAGNSAAMPELVAAAPANVQFVGPLPRQRLVDFLDAARLLVVPSVWWEAFGLVAVEAMMRQTPVVASDTGGLAQVVDHGVNGLLVPPGDANALADALRQLWDDSARRRAMGRAGQIKAERQYSPDAFYRGLISAYQWVLSGLPEQAHTMQTQYDQDQSLNLLAHAG